MLYRKERLDRGIKVRTDGIYAISALHEMLYLVGPRVIFILGLLILPLVLPSFWQRVAVFACAFALIAISWDFLSHRVGLVCLGQALFVGVGGYLAGALNFYLDWPLVLTLPIGTVAGAAISTLLLLPTLRVRHIYFVLMTLVLPLIAKRLIEALNILGGTDGMSGLTFFPNIWVGLYLGIGMVIVVLFALRRLANSDFGMVLGGIRDNDQAVKSAGIDINWCKIQALFIGALPATFAGAYLAHQFMFVGMSFFFLDFSIMPIAIVIVGGPGSLAGAVLGASILVPISEIFRAFGPLRIVCYAILMVVFIVLRSEGLFNFFQRKYHQFEKVVEV